MCSFASQCELVRYGLLDLFMYLIVFLLNNISLIQLRPSLWWEEIR